MLTPRVLPTIALVLVSGLAMTACGGGGGGSAGPPPPAPTASLSASATDVQANGSVTLTWSSTNASSCTASGGWSGTLATAGSKVQTVTASGAFGLSCTGGGGTATASTTITAWNAPAPMIAADVTAILPNNAVTLTWSSQNATACTGADALAGTLALSGSQGSSPLSTTTVFSIQCTNPVFAAVKASVTVTVSPTFTATVSVLYQVPGAPIVGASRYYVPDWAHPLTHPVPFVWVEMQDPGGHVTAGAYADANGLATIPGLDPTVTYTPVIRSKISDPAHGFDFVVLNNTAPIDTSQPTYRARYAPYVNAATAYVPGTKSVVQSVGTVTALDGWDATTNALVDANRSAAPYALLAAAVYEAQIVTAAIGGTPAWRPLTILWSTRNKGGLTAPPDQMDNGFTTSAGYYNSAHNGVDPSGLETLASVAEDLEFISGDQTTEAMDVYPYVLTHEMGHFTQSLFSTSDSPGYTHAYSDFEDPLLAWIEGNASGIAALVLNTPLQNRLGMVGGEIVLSEYDPSTYTVSGNPQTWPLGWYQEATVVRLIWKLYDPAGTIKLPAATVLAPMYTAAWKAGPWLNTAWAYTAQLAKANPSKAAAIDTLADSLNVKSTGGDEWGTNETSVGSRTSKDALPPYTTVAVGGAAATACSAGAPNDYNKESNVRYLKVTGGDGRSHVVTITGTSGTVPLLNGMYVSAGSNVLAGSLTIPAGVNVFLVGDCLVSGSPFTTDTAACSEPATPPAEQCFTVSIQ